MKFTASRLSADNKIFPSEIYIDSTGVTIKIPGFFSGESKHFDFNHIASVEIDTPLIGFSTIKIFAGGTTVSANGFTKAEVNKIRESIDAGKIAIKAADANQSVTNTGYVSVADELKKLKDLLDSTVITQQEFDEQKAKLLNK